MPESSEHPLIAQTRARVAVEGRSLATRATEAGLVVTRTDGTQQPIPIGALPVILTSAEIERRHRRSAILLGATLKAARWRLQGAERVRTLAALSPSERRVVEATADAVTDIAVARVDYLVGTQPQALEVNTTIPAMQGYSDIAAEAWLATFAVGRPDLARLIAANGSNSHALLDALSGLYAARRADELGAIGLLCRRSDAQLSELTYLCDRFRRHGLDARIVHSDELVRRRGYLEHAGQPLQLIYRHLFVSRLDSQPAPDLEAAMVDTSGAGTLILNPATPHLEMKSTLAWLSQTAESPALAEAIGLDDDERDAIATSVPWTRPLHANDTDLLSAVREQPEAFVLKRSWSYGGNEVFVGRAHETSGFLTRVHALYPDVHAWPDLCTRAAHDARGGGFVVQRALPRIENEQFLCTPTSTQRAEVITDYSAYASLGVSPAWSGVCRAAASDVVNIVGGGAVVPILRREVADQLLATL